jgi:hypothetical protein
MHDADLFGASSELRSLLALPQAGTLEEVMPFRTVSRGAAQYADLARKEGKRGPRCGRHFLTRSVPTQRTSQATTSAPSLRLV